MKSISNPNCSYSWVYQIAREWRDIDQSHLPMIPIWFEIFQEDYNGRILNPFKWKELTSFFNSNFLGCFSVLKLSTYIFKKNTWNKTSFGDIEALQLYRYLLSSLPMDICGQILKTSFTESQSLTFATSFYLCVKVVF